MISIDLLIMRSPLTTPYCKHARGTGLRASSRLSRRRFRRSTAPSFANQGIKGLNNRAWSHHHHHHHHHHHQRSFSPQHGLLISQAQLSDSNQLQNAVLYYPLPPRRCWHDHGCPFCRAYVSQPLQSNHPTNEPGRQSNHNGLAGVNVENNKIPVNVDVPIKGNNVANGVANDVLKDGVDVEHVADAVNAGVLGNANQVAPQGF